MTNGNGKKTISNRDMLAQRYAKGIIIGRLRSLEAKVKEGQFIDTRNIMAVGRCIQDAEEILFPYAEVIR